MAFKADYRTPAGTITAFYYLAAYTVYRVTSDVQVHLYIYPSAEDRMTHKQASAKVKEALNEAIEKEKIYLEWHNKAMAAQATGKQISVRDQAELAVAEAEHRQAITHFEELNREIRNMDPQQHPGAVVSTTITNCPDLIDSDGNASLSRIYDALASRPEFSNYQRVD